MIPHRTGTAPSRRCPCPRRAEFDAVLPEQLLDTVRHVEIVIPRGTAAGPPTRGARCGLGGGFRWSNTPSPPCRFHRPHRQSPSGRPTRPGNAAMRTSSAMHWTICLAGPMTTVCRYLNMSLSKGTKEGVVAKRGGLNPDGDAESQFGEVGYPFDSGDHNILWLAIGGPRERLADSTTFPSLRWPWRVRNP